MSWGKYRKVQNIFSVPIEKKVINTEKDGNESVVTIFYKIKSEKDGNESVVTIFYKIKFVDCVKIVFVFLNMKVSMIIW